MPTPLETAVKNKSVTWGTRDFNGPLILAAVVDELALDGLLKQQVEKALTPWDQFYLVIADGVAAGFTAWLKTCRVKVGTKTVAGGAIRTDPVTAEFWNALVTADAMITNKGVVRQWGQALCSVEYRYISGKFETDHLVDSPKTAEAHAKARLGANANVPASTSIDTAYATQLNKFVESLNTAGVFSALEAYMNTVRGWNIETASVDSIVWLSAAKVNALTFTRKANGKGVDKANQNGHLAFAVQPEQGGTGVSLLYHFSGIEANPAAINARPPNGAWELITSTMVLAKDTQLDRQRREALKAVWPSVYFSA